MDIRLLRYFNTVVEEKSIAKAARKIHITQQPLGKQIRELERELDIELLERYGKDINTTEAGRLLYEEGKKIIHRFEALIEEVKGTRLGESGKIYIGGIIAFMPIILEKINEFRVKYPMVDFKIEEETSSALIRSLENGNIEVAFITKYVEENNLNIFPIMRSDLVLAVPKHKDFDYIGDSIAFEQLQGIPIIVMKGQSGYKYREVIEMEFKKRGVRLNVVLECSNMSTALIMVSENAGCFIMPTSNLNILKEGYRTVEIRDCAFKCTLYMAYRNDIILSKRLQNFMNMFEENIDENEEFDEDEECAICIDDISKK